MIRRLPLFALCLAAAAIAGLGLVGARPSVASVPLVSGGSPRGQAILAAELAHLDQGIIVRAAIGVPPAYQLDRGIASQPDNWLYLDARAESHFAASYAEWQAALVGAAYADAAPQQGVTPLAGLSIDVASSSGAMLEHDEIFVQPAAQAPVPPIGNDLALAKASLQTRFAGSAAADNVALSDVRFFDLPRLAPAVTIRVADAAAFVRDSGRLLGTFGQGDSGYDGRIFRVVDGNGQPVMSAAYIHRLRFGSVWVRPDLNGLFRF